MAQLHINKETRRDVLFKRAWLFSEHAANPARLGLRASIINDIRAVKHIRLRYKARDNEGDNRLG